MNLVEYSLAIVAEEAAEVAQAAIKCMRFTTNHSQEEGGPTNLQHLLTELAQLQATVNSLIVVCAIDFDQEKWDAAFHAKLEAMKKYGHISIELGCLTQE